MSEPISKSALPEYDNPPLAEVAFGVIYKQLEKLKIPHVGLFWSKIRTAYPLCEHAAPMDLENIDSTTNLLLPRIWLVGQSSNDLLQIQTDRFFYNWRRQQSEVEYPRFKTVFQSFKDNLNQFSGFLGEMGIGSIDPRRYELTYVNHLLKGEGWEPGQAIEKVVPDLGWRAERGRFLKPPTGQAHQLVFPLPGNQGTLVLKISQGKRAIDELPVLSVDLTAKGIGNDKSIEWFELAHEWIVRSFADVTNESLQTDIWRKRV